MLLKYYVKPQLQNDFPVNWENYFNRCAPLALEIGCGNGEFLVDWAAKKPDWNFLGIELSIASSDRSLQRANKFNAENVRVIMDDARFVLRETFAQGALEYVMMNFPDPWPKDKHKFRRVINPRFIDSLAAALKIDGVYELVTDQAWYAEEAYQMFKNNDHFDLSELEKNPARSVTTKYERKWLEDGREITRFTATKYKEKRIKRILESGEMPHSIIRHKIKPEKVFQLKDLVQKGDDWVFNVKNIFADAKTEVFMLRVVAKDGEYTQNFFVLVAPHPNGNIVKLDMNIQPYRTPAVKAAVYEIAKILNIE